MIKLSDSRFIDKNIIIIGTGGTGSHLVSFLAQLLGNKPFRDKKIKLTLVDEDIVEEKNLRTQKFLMSDIGKCKSEVLSDRYSSIYNMPIAFIDKYIESNRDLEMLMENNIYSACRNIIISCVDNNKARRIIDEFFNKYDSCNELICIDTGNSSGKEERHGQTVVGYKNGNNIILPSISNYCPLDDEEVDPTLSCGEQMERNIQNIGANITSATTVFNIMNLMLGDSIIPGDVFTFNATRVEGQSMKINKPKKTLSFVAR